MTAEEKKTGPWLYYVTFYIKCAFTDGEVVLFKYHTDARRPVTEDVLANLLSYTRDWQNESNPGRVVDTVEYISKTEYDAAAEFNPPQDLMFESQLRDENNTCDEKKDGTP